MTYYCKKHQSRVASFVDDYVFAVVRERLAMPDLANLLYKEEDHAGQLEEIRNELSTIDARIAQTERDYDEDLIDAKRRKRKLDKLLAKQSALEDKRMKLQPDSAIAPILGAPNPAEAFDELLGPRLSNPLEYPRNPKLVASVIDVLCKVTVFPHKRGTRVNPESLKETVKIEWK